MKKLCRKFGFSRWPRRSASIAEQEGADAEESDDQDQASQSSARPPNFADVLCGGGSSAGGKEEGQADEAGGSKRSDGGRGKGHQSFYSNTAAPYGALSHAVPHVPHATPDAYASAMARNSFVGFDPSQAQLANATGAGQPEMLQQLQIFQLLQLLQQQSGAKQAAPAAASGSPSATSLLGGDMQLARSSFPANLPDMASMPGTMLQQRGGRNFSSGDMSSSQMLMAPASSFSMPPMPLQGQGMEGMPHGMQGAQGLQPPQPPPGCSDVLEALKVGWMAGMQMAQSQQPSQAQVQHQTTNPARGPRAKKDAHPLGPSQGPRHSPTVGSQWWAFSYERGTPVNAQPCAVNPKS